MPPSSQTPGRAPAPHQGHPHAPAKRRKHIDWAARTIRIELFIVIVGSALLLAALSLFLGFSGDLSGEAKKVDKSKYQAVFLNGGVTSGSVSYSTYFGKITGLNDKYLVLNDVYYLTDQQTNNNQPASPQLTKLGCQQLHAPFDEMVVNRTQVAFWENLQDSGRVVEAIKEFKKQNPNGPDCSNQNQQNANPQQTAPSNQQNQNQNTNN